MPTQLFDRLMSAVRLDGKDAAFIVRASYVGAGGEGSRLYPPTYPPDAADPVNKRVPYVFESRLVDGEPTETVQLDGTAAQANRFEEVIAEAVEDGVLDLPYIEVAHVLPSGKTVRVTSFDVPHRAGDAYLRDAVLDGTPFDKTPLGSRLRAATSDDCSPLYEHEPLSLLLGFWDSQRKGRQLRMPRVYRSEIFGVAPETGRRAAGRMDPHNLVGAVQHGERATDGSGGWDFQVPEAKKVPGSRLSEIGHGNIAPQASHGGVTVKSVRRYASLSFAGLHRLRFAETSRDTADAARVCLASLAVFGDRLAFARPAVWLRSGCELVLQAEEVGFHQIGGVTDPVDLTRDAILETFTHARQVAADGGLVLGREVVRMQAGKGLAKALDYAYLQSPSEAE